MTTARQLEVTMRAILLAGLPLRHPGIAVRLRNEPDSRPAPCVILSAIETGDFLGVKVAGRVAKICSLEIETRVPVSLPENAVIDSTAELESLGEDIEGVIAAAVGSPLLASWLYHLFLDSSKSYELDGAVRVLKMTFELHALTKPV